MLRRKGFFIRDLVFIVLEKNGKSMRYLAKKLGVHPSSFCHMLLYKIPFPKKYARRLANFIGVHPDIVLIAFGHMPESFLDICRKEPIYVKKEIEKMVMNINHRMAKNHQVDSSTL